MSTSWVSSVDMLADAGIVNFDAAAYVTGAPARFVGSPQYSITGMPPLNEPLFKDEFQSTLADTSIVKNPTWKKVLFGILAAGGLLWGAKKIGKTPLTFVKNIGVKIADFCKNLVKKKP